MYLRRILKPRSAVSVVFFIMMILGAIGFVRLWSVSQVTTHAQSSTSTPPPVALALKMAGLPRPVDMVQLPDGDFWLATQRGQVFLIRDWERQDRILDIGYRTPVTAIERGLLGIVLDPQFTENRYFYTVYVPEPSQNTVVSRFEYIPDDIDATEATEHILLDIPQPYADHNGGQLVFGPDGYLYVGVGDGGGPEASGVNAQDITNLLGTILRIDVRGGDSYTVPLDNPFAIGNLRGELPEIWLYGFRNPWRFSFDAETGDLYIADVGNNLYEEINVWRAGSPAGLNYGWNFYEGPERKGDIVLAQHELPAFSYPHRGGCAAIGGYVYRGEAIDGLQGYYLYADYCNRNLWWLRESNGVWQSEVLLEFDERIISFTQDNERELFVLTEAGSVHQIVAAQ